MGIVQRKERMLIPVLHHFRKMNQHVPTQDKSGLHEHTVERDVMSLGSCYSCVVCTGMREASSQCTRTVAVSRWSATYCLPRGHSHKSGWVR